jgi:hypothetical protein
LSWADVPCMKTISSSRQVLPWQNERRNSDWWATSTSDHDVYLPAAHPGRSETASTLPVSPAGVDIKKAAASPRPRWHKYFDCLFSRRPRDFRSGSGGPSHGERRVSFPSPTGCWKRLAAVIHRPTWPSRQDMPTRHRSLSKKQQRRRSSAID